MKTRYSPECIFGIKSTTECQAIFLPDSSLTAIFHPKKRPFFSGTCFFWVNPFSVERGVRLNHVIKPIYFKYLYSKIFVTDAQ
jgi:hypothetical protein